MPLFRKKPVVIQARLWLGPEFYTDTMEGWITQRNVVTPNGKLAIDTLEGVITADVGDYIIKGVQGEFYPCKPDIFLMTYEEVVNE